MNENNKNNNSGGPSLPKEELGASSWPSIDPLLPAGG